MFLLPLPNLAFLYQIIPSQLSPLMSNNLTILTMPWSASIELLGQGRRQGGVWEGMMMMMVMMMLETEEALSSPRGSGCQVAASTQLSSPCVPTSPKEPPPNWLRCCPSPAASLPFALPGNAQLRVKERHREGNASHCSVTSGTLLAKLIVVLQPKQKAWDSVWVCLGCGTGKSPDCHEANP